MGGGSSDAATTLIALNRLWNLGLSRQALMDIGLPLGADVPVFVFGQAAFAQGVGEQLQAIQMPPRHYIIIRPPQFISTGEIFTSECLTRDEKPITMTFFTDWQEKFWQAKDDNLYFGRNNLEYLGYANPSALSRLFRQRTGQSMREWLAARQSA